MECYKCYKGFERIFCELILSDILCDPVITYSCRNKFHLGVIHISDGPCLSQSVVPIV